MSRKGTSTHTEGKSCCLGQRGWESWVGMRTTGTRFLSGDENVLKMRV